MNINNMTIGMALMGIVLAAQGGCAGIMSVPPQIPTITCEELRARKENGEKIVILDVREENEYTEVHIPQARWFPKSRFDQNDPALIGELEAFSPDAVLVAYCGAGHRSSYVTRRLREMGHDAYSLEGISFWEKKSYPVVRGPKLPPSMEPAVVHLEEGYEHYYLLFKDVVWLDVRDRAAYKSGHIRGAISVPLSTLRDSLARIPKNKEVVLYCEGIWDGGRCSASTSAGRILLANGYRHGKIKILEEGYGGWRHAGYPVTSRRGSKRCSKCFSEHRLRTSSGGA